MSKARREIERRPLTPWRRSGDPFRDAKPLGDLAVLIGGLPDDRDAEEILRDLRQMRSSRSLDARE